MVWNVDLLFMPGEHPRYDQVVGTANDGQEADPPWRRCSKPVEQWRGGTELPPAPGGEPIGVVGALVGRPERDALVDAALSAEVLDVDTRDQPTEAVAHEVDASAAHVSAQVVAERHRAALDPFARLVVERQHLSASTQTKVGRERKHRRPVGQIPVNEDHRSLLAAP